MTIAGSLWDRAPARPISNTNNAAAALPPSQETRVSHLCSALMVSLPSLDAVAVDTFALVSGWIAKLRLLPASNTAPFLTKHHILTHNAIFADDFDVHNNGQLDSIPKTLNLQ